MEWLFFLAVGAVFYFIPTFLAKRDVTAIFVLNLLLGWTFVGWVVALVWALRSPGRRRVRGLHHIYPTSRGNSRAGGCDRLAGTGGASLLE